MKFHAIPKKIARFIIQCFSYLPHILPCEGLKTFTSPKSTESDLNHWRQSENRGTLGF